MAQNQTYLFLVFFLTGIAIGILFDFFRILRRSIKTANIITYIEDVLFWILTGILILYNIWYFNNGEIRIYVFIGIIIGILIYMSILSSIILKIFTKIVSTIINILRLPFATFFAIIKKIIKKISTFFCIFTKKFKIKKGNFVKNGE